MPALDETTPSVELLRVLVDLDPASLDDEARLAAVTGWERIISWATACQNDLLVDEFRSFGDDGPGGAHEPLGLALGVTGVAAYHRMSQAVTLVECPPGITVALRHGSITVAHARLAARNVQVLDTEVARAVDAAVMADDSWRTPSQLERAFAEKIAELDPEGAAARHEARRKERDVRTRNEPDGMISLWALLPGERGLAVAKKLDAEARSSKACNTPGDDRTLAHRRADALVDLILRDAASGSSEPTIHGHRTEVRVTVAWSTLIGADDLPADLTGYGPIDATTARRIAFQPQSVWRRLIVDPISGVLLDYGRQTYCPPQDLQDFVIARDVYCRFPTCDRPAEFCDLDHRERYPDGCTSACNLDPLCRRHHRLKHDGGWKHERDLEDQSSIWTDPAGDQHRKPATKLPTPQPVEPPELGEPPL